MAALEPDAPRRHALELADKLAGTEVARELDADFSPLPAGDPQHAAEVHRDPFLQDSHAAEAAYERAVRAADEQGEEQAVQEFLRALKIAEGAWEWYLAAVCAQRVGEYLGRQPPPYDLERAFRMLRRAEAAYERSGLYAEAREIDYRVQELRLAGARELELPLSQRAELSLYWATAGFGYRPLRVI